MKKALILFLLLMQILIFSAWAASSDAFRISAYKIGDVKDETDPYFALYVVDSVYDSFIGHSGGDLDVTSKVNALFGDTQYERTTTFNADTMVFHVIAMGNHTGSYSLELSFAPLMDEEGNFITASYTMGNARGNFSNSDYSIIDDGEEFGITAGNTYTDLRNEPAGLLTYPLDPTVSFTKEIGESGGNALKLDWIVYTSDMINSIRNDNGTPVWIFDDYYTYEFNGSIETSPLWITRTAIAMTIDQEDFENKPAGEYKAAVTVRFVQN